MQSPGEQRADGNSGWRVLGGQAGGENRPLEQQGGRRRRRRVQRPRAPHVAVSTLPVILASRANLTVEVWMSRLAIAGSARPRLATAITLSLASAATSC